MDSSDTGTKTSAVAVAATTLMLTWLNPHVYIDTVLLLGSIGAAQGDQAVLFAVGAVLASLTWFTALGYAARYLSRFFAKPRSWQVLDGIICILMMTFAIMLISAVFTQ